MTMPHGPRASSSGADSPGRLDLAGRFCSSARGSCLRQAPVNTAPGPSSRRRPCPWIVVGGEIITEGSPTGDLHPTSSRPCRAYTTKASDGRIPAPTPSRRFADDRFGSPGKETPWIAHIRNARPEALLHPSLNMSSFPKQHLPLPREDGCSTLQAGSSPTSQQRPPPTGNPQAATALAELSRHSAPSTRPITRVRTALSDSRFSDVAERN